MVKKKTVKRFDKIYTVAKGQDDYKVWCKGNTILCDYMSEKRRSPFKGINTKRDIMVRISILERVPIKS